MPCVFGCIFWCFFSRSPWISSPFSSNQCNNYNLWSCQKVCDALVYLLDNTFIRFGNKLYWQTIGTPMGTNCAPLVADLFFFFFFFFFVFFLSLWERFHEVSLTEESGADIVEAFNSNSRYLDDLLNIDNIYFDQMVDRIYPIELQLNRANSSDTEASFWIWICVYLMVQFPPKYMINGTI